MKGNLRLSVLVSIFFYTPYKCQQNLTTNFKAVLGKNARFHKKVLQQAILTLWYPLYHYGFPNGASSAAAAPADEEWPNLQEVLSVLGE